MSANIRPKGQKEGRMNMPDLPEGYKFSDNGEGDFFWIDAKGSKSGHWVRFRGRSKAMFVIRKKPDEWTIMRHEQSAFVTNGRDRFFCETPELAEWLFERVRWSSTMPDYVVPREKAMKERQARGAAIRAKVRSIEL